MDVEASQAVTHLGRLIKIERAILYKNWGRREATAFQKVIRLGSEKTSCHKLAVIPCAIINLIRNIFENF